MKIQKKQLMNRSATKNMQTQSYPPKVSALANKVIDKIMLATGMIALVWIVVFLLVAMFAK